MFPKLPVLLVLLLTLLLISKRSKLSFPVLLLLASAFFYELQWDILGFSVRLEQLACLLLFAAILWENYLKKRRAHFHLFVWLVLALIPFTFISSLLVSPAPLYSLKKSLLYLPFFCGFYALFQVLDSREKLIRAWEFFYLCGGWVITFSIPFFFLQILHLDVGMVRVRMGNLWLKGPLMIANIFGSTAAIVFIIALVRVMKRLPEKRGRWFDYLFLAASVSGVMLSYTRTAILGMLLGFILVLVAMFRIMPFKKIIMPFILTLTISVIFVGAMFFSQKEVSRIYFTSGEVGRKVGIEVGRKVGIDVGRKVGIDVGRTVGRTVGSSTIPALNKYKSFFSRSQGWEWRYWVFLSALQDWQTNPLLGMGSESLFAKNGYDRDCYYIPSTWVSILHDWGIIALLLHLLFLLLVFFGLVRIVFRSKEDDARELSLSLIVILIVTTLIYQSTTAMQLAIFWILLAFFGCAVWQFSVPSGRKP